MLFIDFIRADPFYQYSDGLSIALALRGGFRPPIGTNVIPPIAG